ncbi:MAG: hypothetical protein DWQ02_28255 [Bacteroidetes bacterium]|nr:MAG: hypothetical protein DWQ02_28255 [Bacteroidota bacterium]
MQNKPFPILGTAMWGWTIPREICFELLDNFYSRGFRQIDTATNYPINKVAQDFRKAEKILQEWINAHEISDLEIIVKTGSLNNLGGSENNLTKSFLLLILDEYEFLFHDNFHTFSVHWDNRDNPNEINSTFEAFKIAADNGLKIGLSGIKYPEIYAGLNETYGFNFRIQMKHNLLYSDYDRYSPLHEHGKFLAYGINAGGFKMKTEDYHASSSLKVRGGNLGITKELAPTLLEIMNVVNNNATRERVTNFYQCALTYAWYQENMEGIILGTSKPEQLNQSMDFLEQLSSFDYSDLYEQLKKLANTINS